MVAKSILMKKINNSEGGNIMCDTMGKIFENKAIFAKNSDRSPNEPQVVEYYPTLKHHAKML